MREIVFSLKGRIPSKKNSKSIFTSKRGHSIMVSSKEYRIWANDAVNTLALQGIVNRVKQPIMQCTVTIEVTFPDLRQRDLSNLAEGVMDSLVDAKILEDDNWRVVNRLDLVAIGVNKDKAGAMITIRMQE